MASENRYEGIRTVRPNRLTPRGILIFSVIGVILLGLILYYIPWPSYLTFEMTGVEVDADGNVLEIGDFTMEAWYFDYLFQNDRFDVEELQLPNEPVRYVVRSVQPIQMHESRLHVLGYDLGIRSVTQYVMFESFNTSLPSDHFCMILTPPDFSFFVLEVEGRIFIATNLKNPDYATVVSICRPYLDH